MWLYIAVCLEKALLSLEIGPDSRSKLDLHLDSFFFLKLFIYIFKTYTVRDVILVQ
jgi:hypothetical protein